MSLEDKLQVAWVCIVIVIAVGIPRLCPKVPKELHDALQHFGVKVLGLMIVAVTVAFSAIAISEGPSWRHLALYIGIFALGMWFLLRPKRTRSGKDSSTD